MTRPCDRCNIGADYEDDNFTRSAEFSFANSMLAWLCLDCRKDWMRVYTGNPISIELETNQFEAEYYHALLQGDKPPSLEEGKAILKTRQDIEKRLNKLANDWMRSV